MRFRDKVVAVTGAFGGIGSQIARDFRDEGAKVSCFDLRKPEGAPDDVLWTTGDVRHTKEVNAFVEATVREHGAVDILVNGAGVLRRAAVHDITDEEWDLLFDINIGGTFKCTRAALPHMVEQKGGTIINIASPSGIRVESNMAHYSASKAAVIQFTKNVAIEYAPSIRCNSICPGFIETQMVRDGMTEYADQLGLTYDEVMAERLRTIPLQMVQTARNVSDGVLFLASDQAAAITGANLDVSAGELIPR
jgi:NAD(P)-dependent dehydrogenase (short-subunit alcohol dehydrogenase family)